ncbi:MAG: ABC transporter permease [Myxococcota bacterium]
MTRRLRALIRKELRALFQSPIAYVVLTAFLVLNGVYFFQNLIEYNRELFVYGVQRFGGSIETGTIPLSVNVLEHVFLPMASDMSLILLALVPLLTMRVFAEERAQGTDELLLTTPLRPWEIAAAKHLASYGFVLLMLAASAIYPAVAISKENLGVGQLVALYLGQLGYGLALAAIGLACSALSRSQIVAAVLAYAIPFVFYDFGWIEPVISESVAALLGEAELRAHFERFSRGVVEFRHGIYFLGIMLLGYTVSVASLDLGRAR